MPQPLPYLSENGVINKKELQLGLLAALVIYSMFGILDPIMAKENFLTFWFIRYVIIAPFIILSLVLSTTKSFPRYAKGLMTSLLLGGEAGILAMIYLAHPASPATLAYYAGLILVILWAGFVFRFSTTLTSVFLIVALLGYNVIALFGQELTINNPQSTEFAWWLGNNFFLLGSGTLALVGTYNQNRFNKLNYEKNKKLQQEQHDLIEAKVKAEESDILKTAFLSNLSHEIRTPMNGIIGFTEMLLDDAPKEHEKKEYGDIVRKSSRQLLKIINNILDVSRIQTGQIELYKQTSGIKHNLQEIYNTYVPIAEEKGLKLTYHYEDQPEPRIETDHLRLRQIMEHLLDNALKFTPSGRVDFGYKTNGEQIEFFVKDTGIGIEDNHRRIVFDKFRQLDSSNNRSYGGTGIGLSIAFNLVKLLGGKMRISSNPPKGTAFIVTFPLDGSGYEQEKQSRSKHKGYHKLNLNKPAFILIYDPDINNLTYLRAVMRAPQLSIYTTNNKTECYKHVRNNSFDIAILDINDNQSEAVDLSKNIRSIDNNICVVGMAVFTMAEDKLDLLENGFDEILTKPISTREVTELLHSRLQSKLSG
jgi:signal transduction histidine kinase/CheY-like chemotaxis protein